MKYDEEKNFEETKEPRFYARAIRFLNGQRAFLAVWFTEP